LAVASASATPPTKLIQVWESLNVAWRGGSGDESETMKACESSETVSQAVRAQGFCYRMGDYWTPCRHHAAQGG
jgi:hypothetical protein